MDLKRIIALAMAVVMIIGVFASCSAAGDVKYIDDDGNFSYSRGIDENGRFEGVKATDYVELPDYENYKMPYEMTVADEFRVQQQLDAIIDGYTTREPDADTTRAIEDGDEINIDYVGSVDGVEFEGGTTGGYGTDVIIGVTDYIDDFLEQLIGHKPGENFDIEVTFPDDYVKWSPEEQTYVISELAGKDAVFNITINHFYKENVPEINDEFVQQYFPQYYTTARELIADIEDRIVEQQTKDYVWNRLMTESVMKEMPRGIRNFEESYETWYFTQMADNYGMTADDYVRLRGTGYNTLQEFIDSEIEAVVKEYCVIQAICEKEDLYVDRDYVSYYFEHNNGDSDYTYYEETFGMNYIKMVISQEKVLEHLIANMETEERE